MNWRQKLHAKCGPRRKDRKLADVPHAASSSRRAAIIYSLRLYLAVALGSIIGGTVRWIASELLHDGLGTWFPFGTLFVNVTGSFLIGFYAALSAPDGRLFAGPIQRQFAMSGICGGYTTFSIFSLETIRLLDTGHLHIAAVNVGLSLIGWLAAAWGGFALATRMNRLRR